MKRFLLGLAAAGLLASPAAAHPLTFKRAERVVARALAVDHPRSYQISRCSRRTRAVIQCHVAEYGSTLLLTDDGVPVEGDMFQYVRVKLHRHERVTVWWSLG